MDWLSLVSDRFLICAIMKCVTRGRLGVAHQKALQELTESSTKFYTWAKPSRSQGENVQVFLHLFSNCLLSTQKENSVLCTSCQVPLERQNTNKNLSLQNHWVLKWRLNIKWFYYCLKIWNWKFECTHVVKGNQPINEISFALLISHV